MQPLSTRQAQVQALLLAGMTMAQISCELAIKVSTVQTHMKNLYRKGGFTSRRDVARLDLDETKLTANLTRQQLQVLKGIVAGKSFQQIATEMGLSIHTVGSHRHKLYQKMGVTRRAQVFAALTQLQGSREHKASDARDRP